MQQNINIKDLRAQLEYDRYKSYIYSYPHKTAYERFDPVLIKSLWKDEKKDSLFLYSHIPFCGSKCGYCNLFSICDYNDSLHEAYINSLKRQAIEIKEAISPASFSRFAIGGGTPTILSEKYLERLFDIAEGIFGMDLGACPVSIETSPMEASYAKLKLLKERNIDRLSVGIQSFVKSETQYINRSQNNISLYKSLELIKNMMFPVLNIDLIYGIPGQTFDSWEFSIKETLKFRPEEIYIYPLYVRPLTGLGIKDRSNDKTLDNRLELYYKACDILTGSGYKQLSMRCFSLEQDRSLKSTNVPEYSCQEDGMIGLGCGARSYTKNVHYSYEYGTSHKIVKEIIEKFIHSDTFRYADYGFVLNEDEKKRRFILKSLLHKDGIDLIKYNKLYNISALEDYPELAQLIELGYAFLENSFKEKPKLKLTREGLALSDSIGPWLMSLDVRERMERYEFL